MKKRRKQILIDIPDDNRRGGMSGPEALLIGGVLVGGIWWLGKIMGKAKSEQTAAEINTDDNAKIAALIKFNIGKWYNTPNHQALLNIAKTIKDWPGVVKAYSALYNGDNIEEDLRNAFNDGGGANGYQNFINNLAYKGQPQNNTGSGTIQPLQVAALVPNVSRVFLDSSRYAVKLYRSTAEYPSTPYIIYPKGTVMNAAGNLFVQAQNFKYVGSTINVPMYQIKLLNGSLVWVNANTNIVKKK